MQLIGIFAISPETCFICRTKSGGESPLSYAIASVNPWPGAQMNLDRVAADLERQAYQRPWKCTSKASRGEAVSRLNWNFRSDFGRLPRDMELLPVLFSCRLIRLLHLMRQNRPSDHFYASMMLLRIGYTSSFTQWQFRRCMMFARCVSAVLTCAPWPSSSTTATEPAVHRKWR